MQHNVLFKMHLGMLNYDHFRGQMLSLISITLAYVWIKASPTQMFFFKIKLYHPGTLPSLLITSILWLMFS